MKTTNLKKKQHSISLRKLSKPTALFISALFVISILLAVSSSAVQAANSLNQVEVSSVTASSYDSTHTPNIAIDGDDTTWNYWGTNAMITKLPQWLQLNLGTQTTISQITTHFYDGDSRTYTYNIQASTDGSNWNTIVSTKTGANTVTDTFNPTTAKYVKITVTGNTANLAAHIVEITVYQSATQTQTQTQTQTPTPTPTPTNNPQTQSTSSSQVEVSSVTASSYDSTHTPNIAIDGDDTTWNYWGTNAMITRQTTTMATTQPRNTNHHQPNHHPLLRRRLKNIHLQHTSINRRLKLEHNSINQNRSQHSHRHIQPNNSKIRQNNRNRQHSKLSSPHSRNNNLPISNPIPNSNTNTKHLHPHQHQQTTPKHKLAHRLLI